MEITITIKVDGKEVLNQKIEQNKDKSEKSFSQYAKLLNVNNSALCGDTEYDLMFLKQQQMYANSLLKTKGHLFLNEVYDMLRLARTKEGQLVGWIYNEDNLIGDNYVDFGIYTEYNLDFVNEKTKSILLDFNVDGYIWDELKD